MNGLFLELTHIKTENVLKDNIHGRIIYIDPTKIVTLTQLINHDGDLYTSIFLDGPVVVDVEETPKEISNKIISSLTEQIEIGGKE